MPIEVFTQTSVSPSGAPDITFYFDHQVVRAELAGAKLYAEGGRADGGCDVRLTDATGEVLADIVVNPRSHRSLTENLVDIGSALMWSHWRYLQSTPVDAKEMRPVDAPNNANP